MWLKVKFQITGVKEDKLLKMCLCHGICTVKLNFTISAHVISGDTSPVEISEVHSVTYKTLLPIRNNSTS